MTHHYVDDRVDDYGVNSTLVNTGDNLDNADVVNFIKGKMKFVDSPNNVCAKCVYVEDNTDIGVMECTLNPIFPFRVGPANSCAHFKRTSIELNI